MHGFAARIYTNVFTHIRGAPAGVVGRIVYVIIKSTLDTPAPILFLIRVYYIIYIGIPVWFFFLSFFPLPGGS